MSIITIDLKNKKFKLACDDQNHEHLLFLAQKLNSEIIRLQNNNSSASFELLLVMVALNAMDEQYARELKSAGQILEKTNQNFQQLLSSVSCELNNIIKKFEK